MQEELSQVDKKWLCFDIPYRVRAGIGIDSYLLRHYDASYAGLVLPATLGGLCVHHGVHQGRMVAIRWLIEFIGIKAARDSLKPVKSKAASADPGFDFGIEKIRGGKYFELDHSDAPKLARVWDGCSKAVMHPTEKSDHPPVDNDVLSEAMVIILFHLERTIYASPNPRLIDVLFNSWWAKNLPPLRVPSVP